MLPEYSFPLHTLPAVGVSASSLPKPEDAPAIIAEWLPRFSSLVANNDVDNLVKLFVPDGNAYWRDILALTWDYRTFCGVSKITPFLKDRIGRIIDVELANPEFSGIGQPYEDVAWLHIFFKFKAGLAGNGLGLLRLVPFPSSEPNSPIEWKIQTVLTVLDGLSRYPESIGHLREEVSQYPPPAVPYSDSNPTVIIVGGGQSGLDVAARLKFLGVKALIIEKADRFGSSWRGRYDALTLHDPVWYDHLPYLPFPPNWPVYAPAKKLANWFEFYAEAMELDHWLSSTVTAAKLDSKSNRWSVTVHTEGKEEPRVFDVKHVVFAVGFGSGQFSIPTYPGLDEFGGVVKHSCEVKSVDDFKGKKVAVIGSATSAHDIAQDCVSHGIDTTMVQRGSTYIMSTKNGWKVLMAGTYCEGGPPTDIADLIAHSVPNPMAIQTGRRTVKQIAALDKDLLDGLTARGFKLNEGHMNSGTLITTWTRKGGYYLDTGASKLIVDGTIKLKSDSTLEKFDKTGLVFADGSRLDVDVVVFATGLGSVRNYIIELCGSEIEEQLGTLWGLNDEGELNGVFRHAGVPGLWVMMANIALARFNSKIVALQIKAIEEGLHDGRY